MYCLPTLYNSRSLVLSQILLINFYRYTIFLLRYCIYVLSITYNKEYICVCVYLSICIEENVLESYIIILG